MAEPKAQTHIQQLGFFDNDLNSSTHDNIMIWLQKNIDQVLNNLYYTPFERWEVERMVNSTKEELQRLLPPMIQQLKWSGNKLEEHQKLIDSLQNWTGKEILEQAIERPLITSHSVKWEMTVEREGRRVGDKYTLGFIDMHVAFSYMGYMIKGIPIGSNQKKEIEEYSLPYLFSYFNDDEVFFEVKTKIPSVGALLRQINFYKSYKPGKYVVVCPDDRHKELLASQNVGFVKAFAL
ncbi:hypothetical protein AWW67_02150 [Roseivirga seohaensis]|uniref:Uncharacterized protein n=2 Tax=Roseivirga seohaensis TaxID=1914963 RepID=A0A0L8ANM0_9BACT|nr:hypothetical protein [Roseivirga seohaensis]KOF03939.1 hypothetical protein OB69_02715 [Roseivirga seohaensis subsp. aquiponti]KYG83942.1 hypothetical protein AWW67_02150 [Roseivirga seohaensis]